MKAGLLCLTTFLVVSSLRLSATELATAFPSARQLEWQKRELEALIHFGINTFTGREWGGGNEDPEIFNPAAVDAVQWVRAAKAAGARGVVLVAKHHDGFCLWPTATTSFSVKSSPWRNGRGDLVKEVSEAAKVEGLKFGIYLSPADLHEPTFGRNSQKYNDYFARQIRELLTGYGEISQVFFDGANPVHRQQAYDWQRFYRIIRELQPEAVIVIRGPDVRWVGNESGVARQSEWSPVAIPKAPEEYDWPDMTARDLGSRSKIENAQYIHWYPAVATVSPYRGWFWKPDIESSLKSTAKLVKIYEETVGRNAGLLLNLAPNRDGLIPEQTVQRLTDFGNTIRNTFSKNLKELKGAESQLNNSAAFHQEEIAFEAPQLVKYVVLQEDIRQGQRVESFEIELTDQKGAKEIRRATTVGWKRIVRCDVPNVIKIVTTVNDSRGVPLLSTSVF